jgi:hypothetical protein
MFLLEFILVVFEVIPEGVIICFKLAQLLAEFVEIGECSVVSEREFLGFQRLSVAGAVLLSKATIFLGLLLDCLDILDPFFFELQSEIVNLLLAFQLLVEELASKL